MSFISLNSYTSPINIEGLIGGGSGGTVELNGNNTFTGDNEFTQPLTTEKINIQANGLVVESGDIDLTLGGINLNVGNINLDAGDINIGGIISSTNSIGTTSNITTNSLITTSIEFVGNSTLQTVPFEGLNTIIGYKTENDSDQAVTITSFSTLPVYTVISVPSPTPPTGTTITPGEYVADWKLFIVNDATVTGNLSIAVAGITYYALNLAIPAGTAYAFSYREFLTITTPIPANLELELYFTDPTANIAYTVNSAQLLLALNQKAP